MIRILKRHLHLAKNLKIDSKYFQILSIISTDMDFNFIHVTILCMHRIWGTLENHQPFSTLETRQKSQNSSAYCTTGLVKNSQCCKQRYLDSGINSFDMQPYKRKPLLVLTQTHYCLFRSSHSGAALQSFSCSDSKGAPITTKRYIK